MKKRIMILEDHEEMQILYKALFRREKDVEIVSQVPDADEAYEGIKELHPDLIIVDISLPGISGIEFTKTICKAFPQMRVLVVTGHEPERYYNAARKAGADDLIMKGDTMEIVDKVKELLGV